jgi:hypothetical protein
MCVTVSLNKSLKCVFFREEKPEKFNSRLHNKGIAAIENLH